MTNDTVNEEQNIENTQKYTPCEIQIHINLHNVYHRKGLSIVLLFPVLWLLTLHTGIHEHQQAFLYCSLPVPARFA